MVVARWRDLLSRTAVSVVPATALVAFVIWAHYGSGVEAVRSHGLTPAGWQQFRANYGVDSLGEDGYVVRGLRNGYGLFYFTSEYAQRFTRKTAGDKVNSCSGCHTAEELAYSFVNSDRFDRTLGRRVSFEDRVMRCYVGPMNGFVPTVYDPAIRDIRLLARAVAHHLGLSEGSRRQGG